MGPFLELHKLRYGNSDVISSYHKFFAILGSAAISGFCRPRSIPSGYHASVQWCVRVDTFVGAMATVSGIGGDDATEVSKEEPKSAPTWCLRDWTRLLLIITIRAVHGLKFRTQLSRSRLRSHSFLHRRSHGSWRSRRDRLVRTRPSLSPRN